MTVSRDTWAATDTPHFLLRYRVGSYAAGQIDLIAQRLETFHGVFRDLLPFPGRQEPVHVILVETLEDPQRPGAPRTIGGYALVDRRELWEVYRPESTGVGLEHSLVRVLLADLTGEPGRPWPPLVVYGLHNCVLQRLGGFLPPEQVEEALRAALADGRAPEARAIFAAEPPVDGRHYTAAVDFWGYLLDRRDGASVVRFLREFQGKGLDDAARAAFRQDFARLERGWLERLRAERAGGSGVGRFLRLALGFLRPHWFNAGEIALYTVMSVVFGIGVAQMQGLILDRALIPRDLRVLGTIMAILAVAFVVVSLTSLRSSYLLARVTESIVRDLRLRLFTKVQELDAGALQRYPSGDLLSRITSDVSVIDNALASTFTQGFRLLLTLVLAMLAIFLQSWQLALLALVTTPLFAVVNRVLGPRAAAASLAFQEQLAGATTVLQENLGAQGVVRAFGLERWAADRYAAALQAIYRSALRLTVIAGVYGVSASSLATGIQLLGVGVGGWLVIGGQITAGTLFVFVTLLAMIIGPVQSLSETIQELQQATGALQRVEEVLETTAQVRDAPGAGALPALSREIVFAGVGFGYEPQRPILQGIDLRIPAGTRVAFVGPSGCGKSTMLNLLMRIYDPQAGRITCDGADLRAVTIASLRAQLGVVLQESLLFDLSVRENIRLGNPAATDAQVEAAARAAEIHDPILALPRGYDTPVGERGGRLSGGQRQRVAIARAIVRDPRLLLLDEATSALDPHTEAAITQTLERLAHGRTVVSVTHRLASVATFDQIVVFDQGRIVEQGTHKALLARRGFYARLWGEQGDEAEQEAAAVPVAAAVADNLAEWLGTIPLFAGVAPELLAAAAGRLTTDYCPLGGLLLRQGRVGVRFYLLRQGEAEVLTTGDDGQERTLAILRAGDHVGEIALLYDLPRIASVRARTPLVVERMGYEDFHGLTRLIPGLRMRLEQQARARQQIG